MQLPKVQTDYSWVEEKVKVPLLGGHVSRTASDLRWKTQTGMLTFKGKFLVIISKQKMYINNHVSIDYPTP